MIPYFVFLFLIIVCYHKKSPLAMIVVMTLFSVFRYDVGWDYMSYYELASDPLNDHDYYRFSYVWQWLFLLAYKVNMPSLVITIAAILTLICIYSGIRVFTNANNKQMCDCLMIYTLWPYFYLGSFSTIRQALAIAICLLVYSLLYRKKILLAFLFYAFSILIHPSSAIAIVVFPIFIFKLQLKLWHLLFAFIVGVGVLYALQSLSAYLGYYMIHFEFAEESAGFLYEFLLIVIGIWLLFGFICSRKRGCDSTFIGITLVSFFLEVAIIVIGLPSVVSRMLSYFSILLIIAMLESIRIINKHLKYPALLLFIFLFIWYLNHSVAGEASSGFIPYKFIFLQ